MNIRSIHERMKFILFFYKHEYYNKNPSNCQEMILNEKKLCYNNFGDDKMECTFCKILNEEIPSYTIYEDDKVKAFLDINPDVNGHILIIPKKHYTDIVDIDNQTLSHIFDVARYLKSLLETKLQIDGLTFIQNNGDVQEVKHFHLHLKPYYREEQVILPVEDIYEKLKES